MQTENLNIEANKKQLLLSALNRYRTQIEAAKALGITQTQVNRLAARYKIFKRDGVYYDRAAELKPVTIFAP